MAWSTAVLGRTRTVPKLGALIAPERRSPSEAAQELRAQMRAYREVAASRGLVRSWKEWLH
ncbi:hypothetical protein GCM10011345_35730 [Gemmobacter megaterium]|nr:hypothetical protein GCM10011345_35730 [Gemmobacter megaterium]